MNNLFWTVLVLLIIGGAGVVYFTSPKSIPDPILNIATTTQAVATTSSSGEVEGKKLVDGSYVLDASKTSATWEGKKVILANWIDRGTIKISSAEVSVVGGEISKGRIEVDMNSISASQTGSGSGTDRLNGHLKSDDFFNAEKYPKAVFDLDRLDKGETDGTFVIKGRLTIRDVTKPIDIPVNIKQEGSALMVTGKATVDRTVYGVKFGSTKFFSDLGDNVVGDTFSLDFNLALKTK